MHSPPVRIGKGWGRRRKFDKRKAPLPPSRPTPPLGMTEESSRTRSALERSPGRAGLFLSEWGEG
jgi:hypothetical protein